MRLHFYILFLPRIRHRNELTDKDWENAVEGLDKVLSTILEASKNWNIGSGPGRGKGRRVRGRERKNAFRLEVHDLIFQMCYEMYMF